MDYFRLIDMLLDQIILLGRDARGGRLYISDFQH